MNNMKPEGICDVQMVYDGEASPPRSLQIRNMDLTHYLYHSLSRVNFLYFVWPMPSYYNVCGTFVELCVPSCHHNGSIEVAKTPQPAT